MNKICRYFTNIYMNYFKRGMNNCRFDELNHNQKTSMLCLRTPSIVSIVDLLRIDILYEMSNYYSLSISLDSAVFFTSLDFMCSRHNSLISERFSVQKMLSLFTNRILTTVYYCVL